ncbi:unnamed protein product [Parnassius apollo]|uniref:unspecific monooxygenase n=1 Tax=Parnassius apollo TaxID=110799 RepID=A0A8S3WLM9_PARAO|nr:unnamed protein product [Parnassius apollo]
MIKDFDCFSDRGISFSEDGLGANLFHADSCMWYMLRNRFTPLFTSGKLKNMIYLMNERGDKFVDYISYLDKHEQEIHTLVQKYTIATISACAFGLDIDTLNDKMETLRRINKMVFTTTFANELDMMYPGILKKINSSIFPIEIKHFFDHLVKSVIAQRNSMPTNRKDFMDLILELRQHRKINSTKKSDEEQENTIELTDDIIAAQAFVFYVAGYETSATTMTFMLYELAKNPDVQEKLIKELDEVLQRHNGEVTYETLNDMKYMEKVFDETLRMYPLVEPLQRRAQVDYTIPGTKVTINKGQIVLVSPLGIHHDEKYYPDPEKFDPERFSPENVGNRHPCAYMPFGVGPRNCIGMRFAKVQSRMCITKLLSKFRIETSKRTPKVIEFSPNRPIIGPKEDIYLNIVPRK